MRCLDKPIVDYGDVYDACASGIDDAVMAARFNTARADVIAAFKNYELLGSSHQLYMSVASAWGNNTQLVLADITKKEFVDLYSDQMVGNNKPGRNHYDRLMMLAPLGKCPFCGFGQAKTLDHFLSKACYPAFSVLCVNLVPVCTDCNKGKVASVLTQNNQILHPYFEDKIVETVTWLFAEVIESGSVSVRYIVQPPDTMTADLRQRIARRSAGNSIDCGNRDVVLHERSAFAGRGWIWPRPFKHLKT